MMIRCIFTKLLGCKFLQNACVSLCQHFFRILSAIVLSGSIRSPWFFDNFWSAFNALLVCVNWLFIELLQFLGLVGATLIGFLHILVSTSYSISHKIIQRCPFMQTALALQNHSKSFFQLVTSLQKLAVLATFLPYQNSPTLGAIWIPLPFSNENRYIS